MGLVNAGRRHKKGMAIDGNTRDDGFRNPEEGGKGYFAEHNKHMDLFSRRKLLVDSGTTARGSGAAFCIQLEGLY